MASAVTSIYEYPISAASAAYAPTNTAEVTAMIDSAVSGKLDASASSAFQPSGNYQTAGDYVSSSELANYQTTAGMSAYATTAALADKLDSSASSSFMPASASGDYMPASSSADYQTTAGMSGYATTGDLSAKLDTSAIETSTAGVTGIAGTAIAGGGGGGSADWSAESGQPGYIENKPVPKTLVAGAGITITENSAQLVVASTNTLYSAGNGLTLNGTTFSVDTSVVVTTGALTDYQTTADMSAYATTESLSGYVPGTSPIIDTETFAGYWAGSAVYQKIVSGVVTSNASGTAADSDPDYAGKTAWIDPSNSFMIYGSTANILPVNWYLGSARNGGFSLVGTARPIIYRGIDNAATTCTAYVCVKYIK